METPHPRPIQTLLANRRSLEERFGAGFAQYTPPSPDHYPHRYGWDSLLAAIVFARHGYGREAVTETFSTMEGMRPDGLVPNMRFAPNGRNYDLERLTFTDGRRSSDYGQPELAALAIGETYGAISREDPGQAQFYLKTIYPSARRRYDYWQRHRRNNADDALLGVVHPHETGRDSDPTFDFAKPFRLPRNGEMTEPWINNYNTAVDYLGAIAINFSNKLSRWSLAEARQRFWVNDVMFNCTYADNLYEMERLAGLAGQPADQAYFSARAKELESRILNNMHFRGSAERAEGFYAIGPSGPISEVSVSNLFPLVLPNLAEQQLEGLLDLMDKSFSAKYPLPTVATNSPNYDPDYGEKGRLWRGPTWINTNWYLAERGLSAQAERLTAQSRRNDLIERCLAWRHRITDSSKTLVEQGYYEFYSPDKGTGLRVKDFSWSTLADIL